MFAFYLNLVNEQLIEIQIVELFDNFNIWNVKVNLAELRKKY